MGPLVRRGTIMKLILCAALAAMTTMAGAAVNRCVDTDGRVLYTDSDCPDGSEAQADPVEHIAADAPVPAAPRSRWADLAPRKAVNVDAATLKTAYETMQVQDELHKQRLASAR